MSDKIEIGLDDAQIKAIAAQIDDARSELESAADRAAFETVVWLQNEIKKDLKAVVPGLPGLFERRVLAYTASGLIPPGRRNSKRFAPPSKAGGPLSAMNMRARAFVGLNPPSATTKNFPLAAMIQRGKGAYIGEEYFAGSFLARMPNGVTGLFHRTGDDRFPIEIDRYEGFPSGTDLGNRFSDKAERKFREVFDRIMKEETA